jgi:DNA-directed RNA polymerase subunit RPC12/RpoP
MKKCQWKENTWDECYDTKCGNKFRLDDGTPESNDLKFCPYCGGKLIDKSKKESNDRI